MKFDMHCHTKEGSMDGKVMIEEYIRTLKRKGFGGMLVSDHDSYDGYREWKNAIKGRAHQDFVVLKGVEYDTCDCGHILVIMRKIKNSGATRSAGIDPCQDRPCVRRNFRTGASVRRKIYEHDQHE
jgi:predicted metal-dependent phosphoesterase TrpH